MVLLFCLKMLAENAESVPQIPSSSCTSDRREQGTMTAASDGDASAEPNQPETWWSRVVRSGADEARSWPLRKELRMPLPQLLSILSDVYAAKAVGDELDDREENEPLGLGETMHALFLRREGAPHAARAACVRVVAGILDTLRATRSPGLGPACDNRRFSLDGRLDAEAESGAALALQEAVRRRVALFARFLGLSADERPALSDDAAAMYLATLVLVRQGASPLLPLSGERLLVDSRVLLSALDRAFASAPSVVRERVRTEVTGLFVAADGQADAEAALEHAAEVWVELVRRREARLQALFQSSCLGAAIELRQFEQVAPLKNPRCCAQIIAKCLLEGKGTGRGEGDVVTRMLRSGIARIHVTLNCVSRCIKSDRHFFSCPACPRCCTALVFSDRQNTRQIFHKAAIDLEAPPTHRRMMRMYASVCRFDRLDSAAFLSVLRRHRFAGPTARAALFAPDAAAAEGAQLMDRLEPFFAAALRSVGPARLEELDLVGHGHGLSDHWHALEVFDRHSQVPFERSSDRLQ